jgi:16S rRNA (cytidine1402-2'-O)-methyltransferase
VVGGAPPRGPVPLAELVPAVLARVVGGERLKEVVADVAATAGVSRRDLYNASLSAR